MFNSTNFFGLDIGNHSIKAIKVNDPAAQKPAIVGIAYGRTPSGVLSAEDDESQKVLAKSIRDIIESSNLRGVKQVAFAIPEVYVSKRFMTLPAASEEEIENAVYYEMKKWIPYSLDEARINKVIVGEKIVDGNKVVDVLGIAVKTSYLDRYIQTLELAGLEPIAAETSGISTVRLIHKVMKGNLSSGYVVLDFGSATTDVSLAFKDKLIYSDSIPYGSDSITKAISQNFNMDIAKAEEYKKVYGIDPVNFNGKLSNVIIPVIDLIINDIMRIIEYFRREMSEIQPTYAFITGETAKMPGLIAYAQSKLNISVINVDIINSFSANNDVMQILKANSSGYAVALGLAMKNDI